MLNQKKTEMIADNAFATGSENKTRENVKSGIFGIARRKHRGVSIFGVILGVAVSAVVALGLVSAYQGVITSVRTQAVLTTMTTMETTIRRNYANLPQFGKSLEPGLWGAVASGSIQGTGATRKIVTPWGGEIHAGGGNALGKLHTDTGDASNNNFYISALDLPESACEGIGTAYLNRADVEEIYVEKIAAADFASATKLDADPVKAAGELQTNCEEGSENHVAIVFKG